MAVAAATNTQIMLFGVENCVLDTFDLCRNDCDAGSVLY